MREGRSDGRRWEEGSELSEGKVNLFLLVAEPRSIKHRKVLFIGGRP